MSASKPNINNADIEEHLNSFLLFRNRFEEIQKEKANTNSIVERLIEEVNSFKLSEQNLTKQLQLITSCSEEQNVVNNLYSKLKEKYNELDRKYSKVERENLFLQQNHSYEVLELKEKFRTEKDRLMQECSNKVKSLENVLKAQTAELQMKDKKHKDELERINSTSGFQYDEMESYLKSQSRDTASKLQEANNSNNMLRQELMSNNSRLASLTQINRELEKKVRNLEQELDLLQLEMNQQAHPINPMERQNINLPMPTDNLHFTSNSNEFNSNLNSSHSYINKHTKYVPLYRNDSNTIKSSTSSTRSQCDFVDLNSKGGKKKHSAPPLMPLTKKRKSGSKRKLYNLNAPASENFKDLDDQ